MKRQRAMYQMKEQDKTQEKQLNEVETGNLPEKELRIMIVKMKPKKCRAHRPIKIILNKKIKDYPKDSEG